MENDNNQTTTPQQNDADPQTPSDNPLEIPSAIDAVISPVDGENIVEDYVGIASTSSSNVSSNEQMLLSAASQILAPKDQNGIVQPLQPMQPSPEIQDFTLPLLPNDAGYNSLPNDALSKLLSETLSKSVLADVDPSSEFPKDEYIDFGIAVDDEVDGLDHAPVLEVEYDIPDIDEEDEAIMDPDNPLMQRVQDALSLQLSTQSAKLDLEIHEKEQSVKKIVKKREDIGVELYSIQQQLARLQALLEGTESSGSVMIGYKIEAERKQRLLFDQFGQMSGAVVSSQRNLEQHKSEMEKLSATLKQITLYSQELDSQIMVAKRTTLKAESDIIKQELEKKRQDYYIDSLTTQLRRLQEQRALYETQFSAQQSETRAATETLHDASVEMEAIQYEKRQLLHQWKSSLIGLERRESVLDKIRNDIQNCNNQLVNKQGEINGYKITLRKAAEESEALTLLMNKLEGEVNMLKRQTSLVNDSKDKLKESYSLFSKSLSQTEAELTQVMSERQILQLENNALDKSTIQTINATQKIQTEISQHLQSQTSIEKGAQGTRRDAHKLYSIVHEKESMIVQAQNEITGVKFESLNVGLRISNLREVIRKLDARLVEQNSSIEKYELEIRRRNEELGKKQAEMDSLNKKYDLLTGKSSDDSMGPLEATIYNVTKSIESKEKESQALAQFWIRAQNELVSLNKRSSEMAESTQDSKMRLTILNRKKMTVNSMFETQEKEIRDHKRNIRKLQNDMIKINGMLTGQASAQTQLEENNLTLEIEFRAKLKNAEIESLQMEERIENAKEEKSKALDGIIESE